MSYLPPRVSPPVLAALALLATGCVAGDTAVVDDQLDASDRIEVNDLLAVMARDLDTIDAADRGDVRYVTLAHLHNAGASKADLETHRAAISLTLNSLSSGLRVAVPVPVDERATVFRIRLEDYGWDASTWQQLVDGYPYNVRHDEYSEWQEFRGDLADDLREETESSVPYVHGDWLVSAAMQPPLYDVLLGLPDTLDGLERQLGIDTLEATEQEQVARAGFVDSSVTGASRMIARYELPDLRAFWMSCDVVSADPDGTILDEPVDPLCKSREVIFALPNGLPAYFAATDSGARQLTGRSCSNCHAVNGTIPKNDEVRSFVLANGTSDDLDTILTLYPPRDEMADLMTRDQTTFVRAREAAGVPAADPLTPVALAYDRPVNVRAAAATLGLDEEMFSHILAARVRDVPPEASVLLRANGELPREVWDRIFAEMICALGLGATCDPRDGGVCSC
jgi:hypothetical protein